EVGEEQQCHEPRRERERRRGEVEAEIVVDGHEGAHEQEALRVERELRS
ncbi:hypothetical protein HBJ00_22595, partial [Aeromonas veronii]|nr:hypothetical protein [Aeromonas veronii]